MIGKIALYKDGYFIVILTKEMDMKKYTLRFSFEDEHDELIFSTESFEIYE